MERKNYFVGVDIGTSNITMVVGILQKNNLIDIVASSIQESKLGVINGRINNVEIIGSAILAAKKELEESMKIRITEAYVGVSNEKVRCATISDFVKVRDRQNHCISEEDIRALKQRIDNIKCEPSNNEIVLQRIPICYTIDGKRDTQNPVGEIGSWVSATYLAILSDPEQTNRLSLAFQKAHITIKDKVIINPIVQPHLLLSEDEWEDGAAIVDIGSGTTDVSIVYKNKLRHIASLPIGGNAIDEDIASIGISKRHIHNIKRNYGTAMRDGIGENDVFKIPKIGSHKEEQFALYNLAAIIEARLCDIAGFVLEELHYSRLANTIKSGIILTGGVANISGIDKLFARELKMPVRIVKEYYGLTKESASVIGSSAETAAVAIACYGKRPCIVNNLEVQQPDSTTHTSGAQLETPPSAKSPINQPKKEEAESKIVTPPTTEESVNDTPIGPTKEGKSDKNEKTKEKEDGVTKEPSKPSGKPKKSGNRFLQTLITKVLGYNDNGNDVL